MFTYFLPAAFSLAANPVASATNIYSEATMTVYMPGTITQTGNVYDDTGITNESHKVITHQFAPTPQGDAAAQVTLLLALHVM